MLFYENLEEIVFHRHEMFDVDELVVLSGYIGPQPVSRLKELPFKSSVIYGMYGLDSISVKLNETLNKLNQEIPNTDILYSNLPVHSKCYIWKKGKNIVTALIGSANFSVSGLSNPFKEVLAETSFDTFAPLKGYLDLVIKQCIKCSDPSVKTKTKAPATVGQEVTEEGITNDTCVATLLDRSGNVPKKSGLNWGLSLRGNVTIGDAYIPIHIGYLRQSPNIFPPKQLKKLRVSKGAKKSRQNDAVEFIWDDGTIMEGLLEQTQELEGVPYPKAISSGPKKNILGIYLRKRLGVDLYHLITRKDLEAYGRTDIEVSLLGEGVYYMNFSPKR